MDNLFIVAAMGTDIITIRPVPQKMSREEALNLAAWIVAITDEDEFQKVYRAVCST